MRKATIVYVLVILCLVGVLAVVLSMKLIPEPNEYTHHVIYGNVNNPKGTIENRPTYVFVYYPYYLPEYICRSKEVQVGAINWINEKNGTYSVLITVPIGLKSVIITTDCTSCNYFTLDLTKIPTSVNLVSGNNSCKDEFKIYEDPKAIVSNVRDSLNNIDAELTTKSFNISEIETIKEDLGRARIAISDSERSTDKNESLMKAYDSDWYRWKILYEIKLFDLGVCIKDVKKIISLRDNDVCFVPDYESYSSFLAANTSYTSMLAWKPYSPSDKDFDRIKQDIMSMHSNDQWAVDMNSQCSNAKRIISTTFDYQNSYCKTRGVVNYISYLAWIMVGFYIGFFVRKVMKNEKNNR